ncbi:MAG: hypothetical protein HYR85_25725 [Planctomycetes bacterium]|nr:hypothetical protein [Planctomycetota bacterium]MBI3847719.1 hypothetical protein [Planctomycetota bacterium]
MTRTYAWLRALRGVYVCGAIVWGAFLGVFAFALFAVQSSDSLEDSGPIWLGASLAAAALVVFVVGAWKIVEQPFLWSVLMASITTLNVVVSIAERGFTLGTLWGISFTAATWIAVTYASRVRELMREFPDLWISRKLKGERLHLDRDKLAARVNPRAVEARRRAARRNVLVYCSGVIVFSAVIGLAYVWSKGNERSVSAAPATLPAFEPVAAKFIETWNASKVDEIHPFFQGRYQELRRRQLKAIFARRKWDQKLPTIAWPTVSAPKDPRFRTVFPFAGQPAAMCLTTTWAVHDGAWILDTLKFPD